MLDRTFGHEKSNGTWEATSRFCMDWKSVFRKIRELPLDSLDEKVANLIKTRGPIRFDLCDSIVKESFEISVKRCIAVARNSQDDLFFRYYHSLFQDLLVSNNYFILDN